MRCRHQWVTLSGDKREKCSLCKTTFPCTLECGHVDCRLEKGLPLPEWIRAVT